MDNYFVLVTLPGMRYKPMLAVVLFFYSITLSSLSINAKIKLISFNAPL